MLERPPELSPDLITRKLRQHWDLVAVEVDYLPAGHGSHNWTVTAADGTRWFVKVDHGARPSRRASFRAAVALREGGLDSVQAPIRCRSGALTCLIAEHGESGQWELAVFPFIEGSNPDFSHDGHRARIAREVGRLHAQVPVPSAAEVWQSGFRKPELIDLLATGLDSPWTDGPYAAAAHALLQACRREIGDLLDRHDRLAARLDQSDLPWVIPHGEPHGGNTMFDTAGNVQLIDCDDLMIAPRERDLWLLLDVNHQRPLPVDNREVLSAYRESAGPHEARSWVIDLMRADWHLQEISAYAQDFSEPHEDTPDFETHWRTLNSYLPVVQNWPDPGGSPRY